MHELTFSGRVLFSFLCCWAVCLVVLWLYFLYQATRTWQKLAALMDEVSKVSPSIYSVLREKNTSAFSAMNSWRFIDFVKSEELNEVPGVREAKEECRQAFLRQKIYLKYWIALILLLPVGTGIIAGTAKVFDVPLSVKQP